MAAFEAPFGNRQPGDHTIGGGTRAVAEATGTIPLGGGPGDGWWLIIEKKIYIYMREVKRGSTGQV